MKLPNMLTPKRQAIDNAKNTVVATMVVASIVISFSVVTINFLWGLRGFNSRVISEKEKARDVLEENVENIEVLKDNFSIFERGDVTSQEVLDALPSKYDFAALITSVDSLAKRSGMLLESFSGEDRSLNALQEDTQPTPIEVPFNITVSGDYEGLQDFINVLHRSIRPIAVESLELSGSDESITAEIRLITFYQPQTSIDVETKEIE